jgi:ABC-2 type transport system ATP-binding protein
MAEPSADVVLLVDGVHKSYREKPALAGVDLQIAAGEVCALLGPNGAGKTTLASIIAGLKRPDRGRVLLCGIDVERQPYAARARLGYAPQELGIYPLATVRDNLRLFGSLAGVGGTALTARTKEVAEALGLAHLLEKPAGLMSGGEQRRLHTAMALMHRPRLLLLDEPTVGADVGTREQILRFVRDLAGEGSAVCYTTHYLAEVEMLGATVAFIDRGLIIARGRVPEMVARYGDPALELRFAGPAPEINLPGRSITVDGDRVRIHTPTPAEEVGAAIAASRGHVVESVELIRPSLDAVFLALTGSRYREENGVEKGEQLHAVAP